MRIPTDQIDATALTRDRTTLDPDALVELQLSIATAGLRTPIEVFATETGYGLISGFRRLAAVRALHATTGFDQWTMIEATLRSPQTTADALHAMVEENEIREDISPYERARICVKAMRDGHYETLDAAVAGLYPNASRQKRARLRAITNLADELDGMLPFPEALSQTQLLRLATACRNGFAEAITAALQETRIGDPAAQWDTLSPLLREAEQEARTEQPDRRPGRPRRVLRPRKGLVIRRETCRNGYVLRFTGSEASSGLMEEVMDRVGGWAQGSG